MKKLLLPLLAVASLSSQAVELEVVNELSVNETQSIRDNLSTEQLYAFDDAVNNQEKIAVLFKDPGFKGELRIVYGNISDFKDIGMNDEVSSIKIYQSLGVTLYRDTNYRGDNKTLLYKKESNFSRIGLNDEVSSMRLF